MHRQEARATRQRAAQQRRPLPRRQIPGRQPSGALVWRLLGGIIVGAMLLLVAGCNSGVKNEPASTPLPSERVARILGTTFANSTTQTARMVAHGVF